MQIPIERVYGLYDDGWSQAELVPSAFQHPAKFSKKLVYWIIRTGLKRKWWDKGSTLLDPFGGVGLGGVVASSLKLNWIGVELEPRFVKIANGCDCDGFSAMEYRRYLGKPRSARLLAASWRPDLCPDCHARALTPAREDKLLMPLKKRYNKYYPVREAHPPDASPALTPAREIPRQKPHHFTGNFDLYRAAWRLLGAPEPVMLQGDSRFLAKALAQLTAGPSENAQETALRDLGHVHVPEPEKLAQNRLVQALKGIQEDNGGEVTGVVTSPPYGTGDVNPGNAGNRMVERLARGETIQDRAEKKYGHSTGQIGELPDGVLTSPPFLGVVGAQSDAEDYAARGFKIGVMAGAKYGTSEGQLGVMAPGATAPDEPGEVSAPLTSPPYAGLQADMAGHGIIGAGVSHGAYNDAHYGATEGQIGNMHSRGDVSAPLTSPPYADVINANNEGPGATSTTRQRNADAPSPSLQSLHIGYGATEGNLQNLANGALTSPPFSPPGNQSSTRQGTRHDLEDAGLKPNVAALPLQDTLLAQTQAQEPDINTYWGACTEIYKQVYEVLPPGGHMAMVVKGFIRAGMYVDLPKMTMHLLMSIGWLPVQYIEAMQTSEWEQLGMNILETSANGKQGKPVKNKKKTQVSFFRRLATEKGAPAIESEWVLVVKKPA